MGFWEHVGHHVAHEVVKDVAQGAGCMVTLLAMLTGLGALSLLAVIMFS